jgi:hypothetical protein
MPPWGAVKGFGNFRNDQSLMQEQIELVTRWVDGGVSRGNNRNILPKEPTFQAQPETVMPSNAIRVSGPFTVGHDVELDGLIPEKVPSGRSTRIVAALPGGSVEPLVWLHQYDNRYSHPFLFRKPLHLPAGTTIKGVPSDTVIALIPRRLSAP